MAANVASSREAQNAFDGSADGVGLLRAEFFFVDRHTAPSEDAQRQAYQAVLDAMGDRMVIIRTIDVGGDKQLGYLPLPPEANPVLGMRGYSPDPGTTRSARSTSARPAQDQPLIALPNRAADGQ